MCCRSPERRSAYTACVPTPVPKTPAHQITDADGNPSRDRPWIFRTYAGHTSAAASNLLFRENLSRGQTGLSIAFDLPTQCGYSSDHPMARSEVGKVGVPINSIDDMRVLFEGLSLEETNTSMTINGTSMWLFALYIALARERGEDESKLRGTTQNDIVKEYLARGTYIFPPEPSMRLIAEMYEYSVAKMPKWNASNVCSYHLQEAGATPEQELSFALANAIGTLDLLKERGRFSAEEFERCVGRVSFFVNAGIRFVEEMCKMRAFVQLWEEITGERYGVENPRNRRFRYGVQVNSLGLTENQPENNAWRIVMESLAVTLSRKARCRALQLPAWNEAMSLPRPWDQQWSLRLQQILAYETDLLEYPDLFDGSVVVESKTAELVAAARIEIDRIVEMGGASAAIESGYLKSELVRSMAAKRTRIEGGEDVVVGVNCWAEGIASPLTTGADGGLFLIDSREAAATLESLKKTRGERDAAAVAESLEALKRAANSDESLMEASIACAVARVTTGEWAEALRSVFGEYRASTGVAGQHLGLPDGAQKGLGQRVQAHVQRTGHRPRLLVGKPGLDGHSNGAEMIAVAASDVGFEVVYAGIRSTPEELAQTALEESVDIIGLSVLSGSHLELAEEFMACLRQRGIEHEVKVVLGGIVPAADVQRLLGFGLSRVFTPSDYQLSEVLGSLLDLLD
ncbi:MAG: protein meaA [Myxococcales bacterium]|nr:protein meaA [Myxococcales bacterium]